MRIGNDHQVIQYVLMLKLNSPNQIQRNCAKNNEKTSMLISRLKRLENKAWEDLFEPVMECGETIKQ